MAEEEEKTDPKDQETSDWTNVNDLTKKSLVKPYSIDTLATSKVPHNIPYLEVYRTDELYYQSYVSPYLSVGDGTSSTDGGDGSTGDGSGANVSNESTLWTDLSKIVWKYYPASKKKDYWIGRFRDANSTWSSVAIVVNSLGGDKDKQNKVIREVLDVKKKYMSNKINDMNSATRGITDKIYSTKTRNDKIRNGITNLVKKYYRTETHIHYSSIVNKYMGAQNNKYSIGAVTLLYRNHLRSGVSKPTVNQAILNVKVKYSK